MSFLHFDIFSIDAKNIKKLPYACDERSSSVHIVVLNGTKVYSAVLLEIFKLSFISPTGEVN